MSWWHKYANRSSYLDNPCSEIPLPTIMHISPPTSMYVVKTVAEAEEHLRNGNGVGLDMSGMTEVERIAAIQYLNNFSSSSGVRRKSGL